MFGRHNQSDKLMFFYFEKIQHCNKNPCLNSQHQLVNSQMCTEMYSSVQPYRHGIYEPSQTLCKLNDVCDGS